MSVRAIFLKYLNTIRFQAVLLFLFSTLLMVTLSRKANGQGFTRQDTLRGSITPERAWWDLTDYDLSVRVFPDTKYISGTNIIRYKVISTSQVMQLDLQPPLEITYITSSSKSLTFKRDGNVYYVSLLETQNPGDTNEVTVTFSGNPVSAKNAPWDGGFSWKKDSNGNDFIGTSCQGIGASIWWPCKDHMYDEPDKMYIHITAPTSLTAVSNGRLISSQQNNDSTSTFNWLVSNPINNYGVTVNIGDYVHFGEKYNGEKGILDCDYYVLKDNLEKAKEHFKEATKMLKAFEFWLGPYPFYEDGYKLVETPFLGMEHQSAIAYGNRYKEGYLGQDLSLTGWGLKFDYIIVHESAHEWFANSITYSDMADMWVHESFACYAESLFLEYYYGKKAASEYIIGLRNDIQNDKSIVGKYNVNNEGSGDMYPKGANMLHTLRQIVNDDEKWRALLQGLSKTFYHQVVATAQIENFISDAVGLNLHPFFNQYLRDYRIPSFDYIIENNILKYRWSNVVEGFNIPVKVAINENETWLNANSEWQEIKIQAKIKTVQVDLNFYVESMNLTGYDENK